MSEHPYILLISGFLIRAATKIRCIEDKYDTPEATYILTNGDRAPLKVAVLQGFITNKRTG